MNVFNMSGQLVMEDNHPKPETELYFPKGAYFITLTDTNKNQVLSKKIIIE